MVADILQVRPDTVDQALDVAIEALRAGELIIIPTDTVYGLAGELSAHVARRIYAAKNRRYDLPLPVLIADLGQLAQVARSIPSAAELLGRRYWPGPLTLVLQRAESVPSEVTSGGETVGVRVPDHELMLAMLEHYGSPIVATSANPSGCPSATQVSELSDSLLDAVAVVLDAGPCTLRQASTVLDLTTRPPHVLRPGPISAEELSAAVDMEVVLAGNCDGDRTCGR